MLLTFIIIYLLATIGIGIWAGSRVKSNSDYVLAAGFFFSVFYRPRVPELQPEPPIYRRRG